jgi:dTDP-4-amino-4,6-dideoxygalactose transaminase
MALAALDIGPGDEVIVPTLTFCATANVVVHLGAKPVIVDVDNQCQISVEQIERAITPRTRAIIPVHYAGQACDLNEIVTLAARRGIAVVEDAAHAAGCEYDGHRIGTGTQASVFSFYPSKNMTTGEGGMITTDDEDLAARLRRLSLHGMSRNAWNRYSESGSWYYEVLEAGYKNNMTDIQASMGIHQLRRLDGFIARRRAIAARYSEAFSNERALQLPEERPNRNHTYHIYPVQLNLAVAGMDRSEFIKRMTRMNIGCSVHFIPLHRHPYYQRTFRYRQEQFPMAEKIYAGLVSLPLYPRMSEEDICDVIASVKSIVQTAMPMAATA